MRKRNYILWIILFMYVFTLFLPIGRLLFQCSFSYEDFMSFFKELSIPIWFLFFSVLWLYYKRIVTKNEHFKVLKDAPKKDNEEKPSSYEMAILSNKRQETIDAGVLKLDKAEVSIKYLEKTIAVTGIIAGIVGILDYIF